MCGIAGFWAPKANEPAALMERRLEAMAASLAHRGPDGAGSWVDPKTGVGLAHRRLAIRDTGPAGHQPMVSADGRLTLVYNGELYNWAEIARDLNQTGIRFRGRSDTEILLEAFAHWGVDTTLRRAAGMFALALWDGRTLTLARDRFGIKPLCWTTLPGGGIAFASDLSGLRAHGGWQARLDHDAVAAYLRLCYIPGPATLVAGARKLGPGHVLEWRGDDPPEPERAYWSLDRVVDDADHAPFTGSLDDAADAVERTLVQVIAEHTAADVPVGAFLSGGVDSSLVVALLRRRIGLKLPTFTIGFTEAEYDESAPAGQIAAQLGTDHQYRRLEAAQALDLLPGLLDRVDEPLADTSLLPTALVSTLAREQVTVVLTGDGGDEIFGGYRRYDRALAMERMAATTAPAIYRRQVSAWPDPEQVAIRGREHQHGPLWRHDLGDRFTDPISRMQYIDSLTYLPDDILTKVDRASMAASLEARVPLLDHRVAELAWRLPPRLRHGGQAGKKVLRHLLARHLPAELVDRPKMGFSVPMAAWLRGPWRDWAEPLLCPDRLTAQGLLRVEPVLADWRDLLAGRPGSCDPIWAVLALQAWLDRHGDGLALA